MPTSAQQSPDPRDQGRNTRKEETGSRFTAVNAYSTSPSSVSAWPPRSFAFRPDATSPVDIIKDRLDSFPVKVLSETSNSDIIMSPTFAKRKRSPSDPYGTGMSSASIPKKLDRDSSPRDNIWDEWNAGLPEKSHRRQSRTIHVHDDPVSKAHIALEHLELHASKSASPMNMDDDSGATREKSDASEPADSHHSTRKQPGKRRFAHRTKTGCHTCRERKKKCDEGKPQCENCLRGSFVCKGYGTDTASPSTSSTRVIEKSQPKRAQTEDNRPYLEPLKSASKEWSEIPRSLPPLWERPEDRERRELRERQRCEAREEDMRKMREQVERPSWLHPDYLRPLEPNTSRNDRPQPGRSRPIDSPMVPPVASLMREREEQERLASAARYGQTIAPAITSHPRSILESGTVSINPHQKATPSADLAPRRLSEKEKMLMGKPYHHWHDPELTLDRKFCQRTVEQFNRLSRVYRAVNMHNDFTYDAEKATLFRAIFDPRKRRKDPEDGLLSTYDKGHPCGSVGESVLVEAPFTCEYGYNIHVGNEVVLQAGIVIQDPCRVTIGHRSIIGPGVKMYGMTVPTDPQERHGTRSTAVGGPIVIEEDVFIGADAIILPNRTIGKGSTVGAGTVVHEDVPPYTIVAGSPMKVLRGVAGPVDKGKQAESDRMTGVMLDRRDLGTSRRLGTIGGR